jgi:hypothetical protein
MSKAICSRRIVDQITSETDKRFEIVARMADEIVDATVKAGDCAEQDLKGFTRQEIADMAGTTTETAILPTR